MMENEIVDELIHRCPQGHAYKKKQDLYGFTSSSVAVVPDFIISKVQYFLQQKWFRRHC
jgi:hypothetical protein